MKHRLQISAVIENGRGSVIITKQHGRGRKESTAYIVNIEEDIAITDEERTKIDEAILIRKVVRAAIG